MKKRIIFGILGRFMIIEAVLFLLPALVCLIYGEANALRSFLMSALISAGLGLILHIISPKKQDLYAKEGLVIVGLLWLMWSLIGALPFYISGEIPSYVDSFFETVSGFTTTGATILTAVEPLSKGILFWRAFTHWVGGMGVLIFAMALVRVSDNNAIHLMRAEVPGPSVSKLVPRGMQNAKILYGLYLGLSIIEFIMLVCGGMPVYDSLIHTFSTAGTGGFSCKNASIGAYDSAYLQWVIIAFMFLFSINFNLYYFMIIRKFTTIAKDSEWKVFTAIVIVATAMLSVYTWGMYGDAEMTVRQSAFQVVATMSTTGFCTIDYNLWGGFGKLVIILLMFIGACAGSTGGGLKISRIMILAKSSVKTIRGLIRPNSVTNIKINGKAVDDAVVKGATGYFVIYMAIFALSLILVGFDNLSLEEILSSVTTCFNNVGPAFGAMGPVGNFHSLTDFSKIVLSIDMLLGRLEIFPVLMLFIPSLWKRKFI